MDKMVEAFDNDMYSVTDALHRLQAPATTDEIITVMHTRSGHNSAKLLPLVENCLRRGVQYGALRCVGQRFCLTEEATLALQAIGKLPADEELLLIEPIISKSTLPRTRGTQHKRYRMPPPTTNKKRTSMRQVRRSTYNRPFQEQSTSQVQLPHSSQTASQLSLLTLNHKTRSLPSFRVLPKDSLMCTAVLRLKCKMNKEPKQD